MANQIAVAPGAGGEIQRNYKPALIIGGLEANLKLMPGVAGGAPETIIGLPRPGCRKQVANVTECGITNGKAAKLPAQGAAGVVAWRKQSQASK